jgi:hypothetical protein
MRDNGSDFDSNDFINGVDDLFEEPIIEEKGKKSRGSKKKSINRGDKAPKRSLAPFRFGIIASVFVFVFALLFVGGEGGKYVVVTKFPIAPLTTLSKDNVEAV